MIDEVHKHNNELDREVLIHVCKDRTLSYRTRKQKIFNEVALLVFSVDSVEEAKDLLTMVGRAQYEEHPLMPGQVWYKITLDGALDFKHLLDVSDLPEVTSKLYRAYYRMKTGG